MSKRKETPDILSDLMGKKPVRRSTSVEEDVEDKDKPTRKTPSDRLAGRATYDLSPRLKEAIAGRAAQLGIPASQLAHFLLLHAWQALECGEIDPEPYLQLSSSPAFRHILEIAEVEKEMDEASV